MRVRVRVRVKVRIRVRVRVRVRVRFRVGVRIRVRGCLLVQHASPSRHPLYRAVTVRHLGADRVAVDEPGAIGKHVRHGLESPVPAYAKGGDIGEVVNEVVNGHIAEP